MPKNTSLKKELYMEEKKLGNKCQIIFAKDIVIDGKNCILVQNGLLEVLFNKDNALDIVWVKFKGVNISFLSKNGLNDGMRDFAGNFEGGFLYTCGLDNISTCVKDKPVHGSLHYKKCNNAYSFVKEDVVYVVGEISETALFGKNLILKRSYEITDNAIFINDTVVNDDYKDASFTMLYHINYGYPFLDNDLSIQMPNEFSEGINEFSQKQIDKMFTITDPVDGGDECVYYHTLKDGCVYLKNDKVGVGVKMLYDVATFPVTLEWKSMISGDYALGIEPAFSRFDRFSMQTLKPKQSKNMKIKILFE